MDDHILDFRNDAPFQMIAQLAQPFVAADGKEGLGQFGTALPKPTMPATFWVPARRPNSYMPPKTSGVNGAPRRV